MAWYKSQYEQLELELSEFQASSKELEGELERDLDAADKRERALQERAETLTFEVEEWKVRSLSLVRRSSMAHSPVCLRLPLPMANSRRCRGNIKSPRRKRTLPRTHSKKRLRLYATRAEPFS